MSDEKKVSKKNELNRNASQKGSASKDRPPDSNWMLAWLKLGGVYLGATTAFLLSVGLLYRTLQKLFGLNSEPIDTSRGFLVFIIFAVLFLVFAFNILPAIRLHYELKQRPKGKGEFDYFDTAPREKDPYGLFAKGYDSILEWVSNPKSNLLYLTGVSGSGKSSVINAYLKPHLLQPKSGPKTIVIIVRSYSDPLAALKEALTELWQKKPSDYDTLSVSSALQRSARQLGTDLRLLLVFDQFEEFFLLRTTLAADQELNLSQVQRQPLGVPDEELIPLRDFFAEFLKEPPKNVAILLSYRQDYQRLLAPLRLPARQERHNWMSVEPLDFATAASFLKSCPGLIVPDERMERVLSEAAQQEGGRVVMRPIVANLLGLILRRMSEHPTAWKRADNLLRNYVQDAVKGNLEQYRVQVLRALLTDFHTARPRTIFEMANDTGLDSDSLEAQLEQLGQLGLLRCVNAFEPVSSVRVWQISHDFLATLIEHVVNKHRHGLWRLARPWVAILAIILAILLYITSPLLKQASMLENLEQLGFNWNPNDRQIITTAAGKCVTQLGYAVKTFDFFKPRSLDLKGAGLLQNVDSLESLYTLREIDLSFCDSLKNIDGLRQLPAIRKINLSYCSNLDDISGLTHLNSLQAINLSACKKVQTFDALKELSSLEVLNLSGCQKISNLDALANLHSLQDLDLTNCRNLQNIDGIEGLTSLSILSFKACFSIQSLEVIRALTSLQSLNIAYCDIEQNLNDVSKLGNLESLDLSGWNKITDLAPLANLSKLKLLNLSYCHKLMNIDALDHVDSLTKLNLSHCESLHSLGALEFTPNLQSLDLTGCTGLSPQEIKSLQNIHPQLKIELNN